MMQHVNAADTRVEPKSIHMYTLIYPLHSPGSVVLLASIYDLLLSDASNHYSTRRSVLALYGKAPSNLCTH